MTSQAGQYRVRRAWKRFKIYRELPFLDQCMQVLAASKDKSPVELNDGIIRTAGGFISATAAHNLVQGLQKLLQKISPQWSNPIWHLFFIIMGVVLFYTVAYKAGSKPFGVIMIISATFSALGGWLAMMIVSPVPCLLSAGVSALQRRRIPAPYRQKPRNWYPLRRAKWVALGVLVLGIIYGYAAQKGLVTHIELVLTAIKIKFHQLSALLPF